MGLTNNYVFDMFSFNVFACIGVAGGTCVLLRDSLELASGTLPERLTYLSDCASVLSEVQIPNSVQQVETAGEALTQAAVDRVHNDVPLYNDYGPSETHISNSKLVIREDLPQRLASIGLPGSNVPSYVVEEGEPSALVLSPIGVWGELWLGGVQVARGYVNRAELTEKVFVANPWPESDPSGRGIAYRTGDRVRWYEDGEIEFGGRIDFQVRSSRLSNALKSLQP